MAKVADNWSWDEECCLECGDSNYTPSRVPGICKLCYEDPFDDTYREDQFVQGLLEDMKPDPSREEADEAVEKLLNIISEAQNWSYS